MDAGSRIVRYSGNEMLQVHYLFVWRKIQALGLAKEYKKNVTDISKWLHHFFGLAFLNPEDVGEAMYRI
jgi:hypothetical protein